MAACLSTGGLTSHRSAAVLRGVEPIRGAMVEITVEQGSVSARPGVIVHQSRQMALADASTIAGIPVTGTARTLLDLASVVPPRLLEDAVDAALRQHLVTWPELYGAPGGR